MLLYLHIYRFKGKNKVFILQNIPQPSYVTISTTLIGECPLNHKLEHKEKHENGCVALLGSSTLLCKKLLHSHNWEKEFDKLINLSFFFFFTQVLLLLKSSSCSEAVSISDAGRSTTQKPWWRSDVVGFYVEDIGREVGPVVLLSAGCTLPGRAPDRICSLIICDICDMWDLLKQGFVNFLWGRIGL